MATGYALLCISLVSMMNPYAAGSHAAADLSAEHASSGIYWYVQTVGIVFLASAPPSEVCLSLGQHSNSTLVLGGTIGGVACEGQPRSSQGMSSLSLTLSGREDTIVAWNVKQ